MLGLPTSDWPPFTKQTNAGNTVEGARGISMFAVSSGQGEARVLLMKLAVHWRALVLVLVMPDVAVPRILKKI